MRITPEYLEQNRLLHAEGQYGLGGHRWANEICEFMAANTFATVLDYGCGQGTLKKAFRDAEWISEYDPAIAGKDAEPEPADLVVCLDVLEHIEPGCLDAVLEHIRGLARRAAFLAIHTAPAGKTLPDGRNAHLIIKPHPWWRSKLNERFRISAWNPAGDLIGVRAIVVPRTMQ